VPRGKATRRRTFIAGLACHGVASTRRARRAGGDVGDRLSQWRRGAQLCAARGGLSRWPSRGRLCRRPQCADRISLGGGHNERLATLAADLVQHQVAIIAATSTPAALAAKAATTIPIVFETAADPVSLVLVTSLNRPVGNVTGITQLSAVTVSKRLELLHELFPQARAVALLVNPNNSVIAESATNEMSAAAKSLVSNCRC
jgi:hypothetical protein